MVELLDSKEIHSIESRMIALLDRTFLKSTKLDSVDYKKELPKNVKRWFSSKTFEIQLDNLITELIKFSLLYADSQMKILTAAKVEEGTILTKEAIARATDISETAAKSIIKMLEDDAIYYEGPAKLGRRIEDLWQGQRSKAVSFAHTFSADVATGTTVYRYRQYGVQFMEFSAKIDERTTDQCRCLHGTMFDLSKDSVDKYRAPLHHRCRSALLPIPNTREPQKDMIFENRDFSGTLDSPEDVTKVFKDIEKFNDKYRVSGFVIDQDLSTRIMIDKGVSVGIEVVNPVTKAPLMDNDTFKKQLFDMIDEKIPTKEIPHEVRQMLSNAELEPLLGRLLNIVDVKGNSMTGGYIILDTGEQIYVEWSHVMSISKFVKKDISEALKRNKKGISEWVVKKKGDNYRLVKDD